MKRIDLNCDMGELPEAIADGTQETLMQYITSANIACGGHAGDKQMMRNTIEQALRHNVAIGAHPGYEDRPNFGRIELQLTPEEISASVERQVRALDAIAQKCGSRIVHIKPHGALYNQAARDRTIARSIAEGVRRWRTGVTLVGLAGSIMLEEFLAAGFAVAAEAFADRRYEPDGSLRRRKFRDALLFDPEQAAAQALQIVEEGTVVASNGTTISLHAQTLCLHGDTPGSPAIGAAVCARLTAANIQLAPPMRDAEPPFPSNIVKKLTGAEFKFFIASKLVAAIHFDAEWDVGYLPTMRAKMLEAAQALGNQVGFGEVDVDRELELAKSVRPSNVPAVAYYRNGNLVGVLIGVTQDIRATLERLLRGGPFRNGGNN